MVARLARAQRPGKAAGLALTLALAVSGGLALSNTDRLVESGFVTALERPAVAATQTSNAIVPVAGSEEFWLSSAGAAASGAPSEISLAAWTAPVKLGGTVKLSIAGEERVLEVLGIAEMPETVTHVDTAAAGRLVVVSLREAGKPDAAVIRFVVETGALAQPKLAVAPRAL